eukprot:5863315-Amphidinium_carterae.1
MVSGPVICITCGAHEESLASRGTGQGTVGLIRTRDRPACRARKVPKQLSTLPAYPLTRFTSWLRTSPSSCKN